MHALESVLEPDCGMEYSSSRRANVVFAEQVLRSLSPGRPAGAASLGSGGAVSAQAVKTEEGVRMEVVQSGTGQSSTPAKGVPGASAVAAVEAGA